MSDLWTDPRYVWIAALATGVALMMSGFLFGWIVWLMVHRSEKRAEAREVRWLEELKDATRYMGQVAKIYEPVSRSLAEMRAEAAMLEGRVEALEHVAHTHPVDVAYRPFARRKHPAI